MPRTQLGREAAVRLGLLAATAAVAAAAALPAGVPSHFADFGPAAGDKQMTTHPDRDGDIVSYPGVKISFNILGRRGDTAFISANGCVSFEDDYARRLGPQPHSPPFQLSWGNRRADGTAEPSIAVVWGDLDLRQTDGGAQPAPNAAYYRAVGKDEAGRLARPGLLPAGFTPTRALVATWYAARCYPASASESQKRAITAQLVLFADGTDPAPGCRSAACLGGTVAVWRYSGRTLSDSPFGAGLDSGVPNTGAVCYASDADPSLDRDQCDAALLPFFGMRKAPKKMAGFSMTTAWGTALEVGEFAYRVDRPLDAPAPAKRTDAPPPDPSVPEQIRNIVAPGSFAPFGPAAGDKTLPACTGECFSTDVDLDFIANVLGQKPSNPQVSNRGYVEFRDMTTGKNPNAPGLGGLKRPPFRAAVTHANGKAEAPAVLAPLWGEFDTSVVNYTGTAPRPNTVYFRRVFSKEARMLAGPVADLLTKATKGIVVTWYQLSDSSAAAVSAKRSYSTVQLVLLSSGSLHPWYEDDWMGRTVAIFRYDSGLPSDIRTGSGLSGGLGDPAAMCAASAADDFRFDRESCDGLEMPRFGETDNAHWFEANRQQRAVGTFRPAGVFAFRLDREEFTAAVPKPSLAPVPVTPTNSPVSLPPVTETPAAACAAAAAAAPVSTSLSPAVRITTRDRSPYAFKEAAVALMCLPEGTLLKVRNGRFLGENAAGADEWQADLLVYMCSGRSCTEEIYGRMKVFAQTPLGPEAAAAGLVSATYFDKSTPLPATAPLPGPLKPTPKPDAACATPAPLAASPDPGLVLTFGGQPSLDIVETLLPHLCLPDGSRIEVTPAARAPDGTITLNASLSACAGKAVDRAATSGCPALAAGSMRAFAASPPAAATALGVTGAVFVTDVTEAAAAAVPDPVPLPVNCSAAFEPLAVESPRLVLRSWRKPTAGLRDDVATLLCLEPGTSLFIRTARSAGERRAAAASVAAAAGTVTYLAVLEVARCRGVADASVPGFADCAAEVAARMDALATAALRSDAVLAIGVVGITFAYDFPALPPAPPPAPQPRATAGGFFASTTAVVGVAVGAGGIVVALVAAAVVFFFVIRQRRTAARSAAPVVEAEPVHEMPVLGEPVSVVVKQAGGVPEVGFGGGPPIGVPESPEQHDG